MSESLILTIIVGYFAVLILMSYLTSRGADTESFFVGNKSSKWYVVAFGMIGASLSGVTFISVPGWVDGKQFAYMQIVLGYLVGYLVVAYVLLPIYYRMNLISIYGYLEKRFGFWTYKTGSSLFLISRIFGASIRLLLAATVFHQFIFAKWGIPFSVTVAFSILFIWLCTFKGGIKTIVWTDTLQTAFMLLSLGITIYLISDALNFGEQGGLVSVISESKYSKIFFFDDWAANNYFWKQFITGMFITIGMTGLDQDLMQKNLSCKNIKDAQKNMVSFAFVLTLVNLVFLVLGATLFMYAAKNGIDIPMVDGKAKTDLLFPTLALSNEFPTIVGVFFILGLFAATYASADSALASLTTSFCVDFIGVRKMEEAQQKKWKDRVHVGMSLVLLIVILALNEFVSTNAIEQILTFASFTYGPLIGIFAFGIFTKRVLKVEYSSLIIAVVAFACSLTIHLLAKEDLFFGIKVGGELIVYNSLITFLLMYASSKKGDALIVL
ncbi:MAG: sodium:solute symporter [Bacteroidetes bacterium]|nr:sodium:solute symporter [Bacteroidota bacterium]